MISDDLEALALADAVGALDPDERPGFEARVAALPAEEQARVARLYEVATALGSGVDQVEPPPRVRERVMAATRKPQRYTLLGSEGEWSPSGLPGIDTKILALDKTRGLVTLLIRAEPGAVYPSHHHSGPEECYVLKGSVIIDNRVLRPGDFHHADEESDHGEISTIEGAEVLLIGAIADYLPQ